MMLEDLVRIGPMLVLAGVTAGWMAEAVSRAGGYGFTWDMALGLAGSVLAGVAFWAAVFSGAGLATTFLTGCAGAALLIAAQRSAWRSSRSGT